MKVDLERSEKHVMEEMCVLTPYGRFKDRQVQDAKHRETDRFTRLITTFPHRERSRLVLRYLLSYDIIHTKKNYRSRSDKTVTNCLIFS